jgi:UDP-N-acetylmuramate--alanine ligase
VSDVSDPLKRTYHFIGIGGIGVSAVARVLLQRGARVQGSDVRESQLTLAMRALGARVTIGHSAQNLDGAEVVVYSTAVPAENIELVEARRRGLPLLHRSEALALSLEGLETVGVTGTHGKGTVSAMIAHGLVVAGLDPTFVIGGLLNQYGVNARAGRLTPSAHGAPPYGVAEVDESDGSHLNLRPQVVVINNLEVDHLNYYADFDHILRTMADFLNQNDRLKVAALNWGDEGVRRLSDLLSPEVLAKTTRYGAHLHDPAATPHLSAARFTARAVEDLGARVRFDAYDGEERLGAVTLKTPGAYNAENAMGALSALRALGVSVAHITEALCTYEGLENRFTVLESQGVTIVKDYLSHPTGMRKVLESARRFGGRRVWCVFKPYRFTLMRYHAEDYAEAFRGADEVVITTMYAANEPSISGVNTPWFVERLRAAGNRTTHLPNQDHITPFLQRAVSPGDMVFFFGGDDFFQMADTWSEARARGDARALSDDELALATRAEGAL